MEKVLLGTSDVAISPIVFGAWAIGGWMWGGTDDKLALEALKAAYDKGITSIDTAPIYGLGHSEKVVGKFIKEVGKENVQVLTKFGWNWKLKKGEVLRNVFEPGGTVTDVYSNGSREAILMEVDESLQRLGIDCIDLYQYHRPDPNTPVEESAETCLELQKMGKIKAFGVSNMSVDLMQRTATVLDIAVSQSPYSMVYRKIEKDILPHAVAHQIGILAYSPLQRGLLTGKITSDHRFGKNDHRAENKFFKEPNRSRTNDFLQEIKPIAEGHDITLAQLVINWTVRREGITAALVGARDAVQAVENAKAMDIHLSDEEISKINDALDKVVIDHEV